MLELFKLLGIIAIDNSGANEAIDKTTDKAEKARYKISQAFGKLGDVAIKAGKVIASGVAIGATAMAGFTTKALKLGGELEQNMGGSVAVFGDSAKEMQEKATEAYYKMGLSASDYLATANKMGSLFQGAGFSAETAADMTARAMQRAADVASIMGIDTASAMEAIAGAAKANFTMMDNLGIKMDATSIQAYALSKGITKVYSDMSEQEKIGLAMEMFLEKTAKYADNYAKENDTLAGSLTTTKAALSNFLSGVGDAESLIAPLRNVREIIVDRITSLLPRVVEGLGILLTELLPEFFDIGVKLVVEVATGIVENLDKLTAPALGIVGKIIDTITDPENLELFADKTVYIIGAIADGIVEYLPRLVNASVSIIEKIVTELTEEDNLEQLFDASLKIILAVGHGLFEAIPKLVSSAGNVITSLVSFFLEQDNIDKIDDASDELVVALGKGLVDAVPHLVESVEELRKSIVKALFEFDWRKAAMDWILDLGQGITDAWEEFQTNHSWFADLLVRTGESFFSGGSDALIVNGSHADGLDYVPFDGYIAELHKGEMVIPAAESMRIRAGVAPAHDAKLEQYLQRLIEMLSDYFPQIVNGMGRPIEFNPNSMAAALAVPMNQELGRISARKDRGR